MTNYKMDTDERVCFYEQEFYVLSNFSAFRVFFYDRYSPDGVRDFDTAEHCYHYQKFVYHNSVDSDAAAEARLKIIEARSAHDAFKIAQEYKIYQRPYWNDIKFHVMKSILMSKVEQHEYVARKLLETGERELVEDSWRCSEWGWGPDQKGKNMLGKLWMEVRSELRKETIG